MGLLRKRFVVEIEGTLDFQGIEYEDVLDFVKFDTGRSATGARFTQARGFPGCGRGAVCRGWLRSNHHDRDRGAQRLFDRGALQLLPGQTGRCPYLVGPVRPGDGRAMEAIDRAGEEPQSSRVREALYRTDHRNFSGTSGLSQTARGANSATPRPRYEKSLASQHRECLSSKEPIPFRRTGNAGCERDSPDCQRPDNALWRSGR